MKYENRLRNLEASIKPQCDHRAKVLLKAGSSELTLADVPFCPGCGSQLKIIALPPTLSIDEWEGGAQRMMDNRNKHFALNN